MKIPGPDHPITIEPSAARVRVLFNGAVVADSAHALRLCEARYKPVFYIPRADARMELMERTANATHCPYKGDASYYTIRVGDRLATDAAWSYESPYLTIAQITEHLAFYPDRVDAIEEVAA